MKKPNFIRGDIVEFAWSSEIKVGEIFAVDTDEFYDIMVPDEGLYKHVPKSCVRMPAENDPPERFILRKVKQRRGPVKGKQTYEAMRLCLTAEEAYEAMKILRGGPINVFGQMFFVTYDVCAVETTIDDSSTWNTFQIIEKALLERNIVFLVGPKKCGKTTCMRQMEQEYRNSRYINFKQLSKTESMDCIEQIKRSISEGESVIYLLDDVAYAFRPENEICAIADALTETGNTDTKMIITGNPAIALIAWARRAFGDDAAIVEMDFLHDITGLGSLREYLQACLDETDISNSSTSNYIFGNENHLLNVDVLLDVCRAALQKKIPEEDSEVMRQAIAFLSQGRLIRIVPDDGLYLKSRVLQEWISRELE